MLAPWQWPSAAFGLTLVETLDHRFDPYVLRSELDAVMQRYSASRQVGPHHNGKWNRLGLFAPSGDPFRAIGLPGETKARTEVLDHMPTVARCLDLFGDDLAAASLSIMEPGASVRWHRDPEQTADSTYARLHLPLMTTAASIMDLGHKRWHLAAGQLWYGDFSFPHRVFNNSRELRIHVMIDVRSTPQTQAMLSPRFAAEKARRTRARKLAARIFDASERLHAEGRYAIEFRRARDQALREGRPFDPAHVGMLKAAHRR